ncbi:glycosyltransferase family 2 protein [Alteromonas sp. 5E99-2]|uniref:glycosyltransferase family 2 protein n=1 Tax=Alteromonas sp. 5E99-2 TaxID=2817683 RepID=UPI001A989BE2|nr:glycosyltransferase family 2 protein [Alteromonas sp. 5E99-2]MBO1254758.1 glycosyltransferase family 2 protein [Alteromonas sp. 5E99-2]
MRDTESVKVKLAAIARDEAAYLPEWIFHHLEFGFDEIEIYINNTSDNSLKVLEAISVTHPVVATNADALYQSSNINFQPSAYKELADKAIADGFTHIMFLDIDEFWTPADFQTTIKQALQKLHYPEVLCLNWFIHCDEDEFSSCYKRRIEGLNDRHVKTLFQLNIHWDKIDIHNVIGKEITYTRGDGSVFNFGDSSQCAITERPKVAHDFFIIHRMFRSQMEYIALIGRGRPNKDKIKTSRGGYYTKNPTDIISFEADRLNEYYRRFEQFIDECQLSPLLNESRNFIRERFENVIEWAKTASPDDAVKFIKVFQRVDLSKVAKVRNKLINELKLASLDSGVLTHYNNSSLLLLMLAKLLKKLGLDRLRLLVLLKVTNSTPILDIANIDKSLNHALSKVNYPKQQHADIYRELAIYWYERNEMAIANVFISKAKELRPNGSYIMRLYNEISTSDSSPDNVRNNV